MVIQWVIIAGQVGRDSPTSSTAWWSGRVTGVFSWVSAYAGFPHRGIFCIKYVSPVFFFFLRYLCSRNLVQIYAMSIMSSLEDGLDELLSWGPPLQHFKTFFVGLSGSSNNLISLETEWLIQDYRNLLEEKNKSLNNWCRALHWIFLHLACPHGEPCLVMTSACIPVVNCAWWWPVNASSWTSPCIPMVNMPGDDQSMHPHGEPCLMMTNPCILVVNCDWWWPIHASS